MAANRINCLQNHSLLGAFVAVLVFIFVLFTSEDAAACETDTLVTSYDVMSDSVDAQAVLLSIHDMIPASSGSDHSLCLSSLLCDGCLVSCHCVASVAIEVAVSLGSSQSHHRNATTAFALALYVSLQPKSLLRPPIV